jgi:chemotaxis protein histidine kinase CheA
MSKTIVRPTLSLGNHIYLYRLLRDAIGCGKQTFMTQVEEALAAGDMTAYDLGFESTRELLEELNDCIKLTVFKGGRLYATVIANEAWDAALAKGEDKPKTAKGAKQSYKKKKRGEKELKAVRPKHVKRPEPKPVVEAVPEPEPETEIEVAIEVTAEAEIAATTDPEVMSEQEATVELNEAPKSTTEEAVDQPETPAFQNSDVFGNETEDNQPDESADQDATESAPEPEMPQPAISLTVVYDPENANAGITTMASTPIEAKSSVENESATQVEVETEAADAPVTVKPAVSTIKPKTTLEFAPVIESVPASACDQIPAPAPASVLAEAPTPAPVAPAIPEDFPVDFATEVFCPGPLLHQLSTYLPYGADTLGIVGEYYWIARERGTIEAARNRASFPLRYTQAGERREVAVRIRRNTTGGLGSTWAIDKVEEPEQ